MKKETTFTRLVIIIFLILGLLVRKYIVSILHEPASLDQTFPEGNAKVGTWLLKQTSGSLRHSYPTPTSAFTSHFRVSFVPICSGCFWISFDFRHPAPETNSSATAGHASTDSSHQTECHQVTHFFTFLQRRLIHFHVFIVICVEVVSLLAPVTLHILICRVLEREQVRCERALARAV